MTLREDAQYIIEYSIRQVLPDEAVKRALKQKDLGNGNLYVVAAGKAAWQMANTAFEVLGERIKEGVVCTKYDHVKAPIPHMTCYEGGHPVPDENSYKGTQAALDLVADLRPEDTVLFLLSGGGSALFEKPLIPKEEMADLTGQLLACGADITEINTIRKRVSAVKGGRFAELCSPAHVYSIVLSDVLGNPLDMIASGPAYPDSTTSNDAREVVRKYDLKLSEQVQELLGKETPKQLDNVETVITGSVSELCEAAGMAARELGYDPVFLTDMLEGQAREAGGFLAAIAKSHQNEGKNLAYIAGGETTVVLTGKGKGGRNQELALSGAIGISGLAGTAIFSVGSDGTDGPTDAAGGYCDGETYKKLKDMGIDPYQVLKENDAYHALEKVYGLIMTGPTGTNVNDVAVLLIKR